MKILVFDNYDSFTYNLVHLIKALGYTNLEVHRNDKITLEEIKKFDKILLSPGPGVPSEAGILHDVIKTYAESKSILGVCLGHQAIGEVFGGTLTNLDKVYHGIAIDTKILLQDPLFNTLPEHFKTGRYHSWVVDKKDFPNDTLEITAEDDMGKIMALRHRKYDVKGVQFHPESILTEHGEELMRNWLRA
ncbi:MAG TPA: aminodeoxychorismate/anthranilate synthase component II [Cytophagales bacterium]|nr:aminodeoxychorismate/anthranilate synthase component II [Cytophagales bacterium]